MQRATDAVAGDFDDTFAVQREAVVAGLGDVGAERGKARGDKQRRVGGAQMKHGHADRAQRGGLQSDRNIPWIAMGPGVRRGYSIQGPISTMDTAATALAALGLQPQTRLTGKPIREIFS